MRLALHDVLGRRVAALLDEERAAGTHRVDWSPARSGAGRVPPGVYVLVLEAGGARIPRRVAILD